MKSLERLFRKKQKLIIGLISGTSADGIDAVLVKMTGSGEAAGIRQLAFETYPYPARLREFIFTNSRSATAKLDDVIRLDMLIAFLFAEAAEKIAKKGGKRITDVDLIGSHGQTILHLPGIKKLYGRKIRSTCQIGNPSAIAKLTGVITIGDFRTGDIALGGSGAPLVPLFDFLKFRSDKIDRGVLNIGGIANITILPGNCSVEEVFAFDTGPGNMIIDRLMRKLFRKPYDKDGRTAAGGKIVSPLLQWLLRHPYIGLKPPKSTGREIFGQEFTDLILRRSCKSDSVDTITTVTEFTALSIYKNYLDFIRPFTEIQELIVSGGGIHNKYIMEALRRYFSKTRVRTADEFSIPSDSKEAICFAVLANETISGNPGNVPLATGAKKRTVLGTICPP